MRPLPATTKLPDSTSSPTLLRDRQRLTGQHRLVEPETGRLHHDAVDGDLAAGRSSTTSSSTMSSTSISTARAVADDRRPRFGHDLEAPEFAPRPHLLEDTDHRVRHHDADEQTVLRVPGDQDQHEQRQHDRVHDREHVGGHDLAERAVGWIRRDVDPTVGDRVGDLRLGQPAARVDARAVSICRIAEYSAASGQSGEVVH